MKTDKVEYFRDPGVTWLQILYLEAFHCVDFFSVCFIVFVVFFIFISLVFTFFHYFSLFFFVFQLFNVML